MPVRKKVPQAERVLQVSRDTSLSVPVYSLAGAKSGQMELPKQFFGQKVNKQLILQAARVYSSNLKNFTASTKTRGEVIGSTAKIFRQKGTGRARHGSITAPIFVGGGIVFGPKPRQVKLDFPRKMKKAALVSALSSKAVNGSILGLTGADKATGKTKQVSAFLNRLFEGKKKSVLLITEEKKDNLMRAARNIPATSVLPISGINAYEVLRHEALILTKEALEKLSSDKAERKKV